MNNIESTVISSRIRLARNLADYPFPNRLRGVRQAKEIIRIVSGAMSRIGEFKLYYMDEIEDSVAMSLRDDHLISDELAANKKFGAALIDEGDIGDGVTDKISVMINEEDHLREQYIVRGLNLNTAYLRLSERDDALSRMVRFAFDSKLGYLTACPTNLGTGLRASVMLFLPGLTRMNKMGKLFREISRLGHTVRGVYGEGSAAEGYMYQISNEVTLGVTEDYILSEVQKAVVGVVTMETKARRELVSEDYIGVKDECRRAYGILTHCEKISYKAFLKLISGVKLGASLGFVDIEDAALIDGLVASLRPSNLSLLSDTALTAAERDVLRAEKCRAALGGPG